MITIKNKEILFDGTPRLVLCGEIHYYRLHKEDWQDRITKLKEAGYNTVASYIPWICHEEEEGCFDLDGRERPELDLIGFIDLCKANDLYFIARPGPFIMAEMKNEGIPHWMPEKYPEIVPITWEGKTAPNPTLDYLAPAFLEGTKKWYAQVMPILAERLYQNGGNVIALQLDNEIGMLSWCANSPDLTDKVITDMTEWLSKRYDKDGLNKRYNFNVSDFKVCKEKFMNPEETYTLEFHQDLGNYMRYRTACYVSRLKEFANEYGVKDIPFLVNIHGTSAGRCMTYPIGISQLYEAYTMSDEYLSGSDIYIGSLTMTNFQDLYLVNTYMDAVNRENQPLTSLEFECGDSNYGETLAGRNDVSAVDFKTRMCIAQGNRMLNCYLFSGGINYVMKKDYHDGNNRIAITGERHGFAAPVSPEGKLNYTYPRMARVMKTMLAMEDKITQMKEEYDSVAFSFLPDYYMTEYCYPKSEKAQMVRRELEKYRGGSGFECVTRAVLLNNFRFTSVDLQQKNIPDYVKTMVVLAAPYMAENVQTRLGEYVKQGGGVILYGRLPVMDMEGNPCTILKDMLGVTSENLVNQKERFYLSGEYDSYLSGIAEIRTYAAETYEVENAIPIMRTAHDHKVCAFEKQVEKGTVILIGIELSCNLKVWKTLFQRLGSTPAITHDYEDHGLFITMMAGENGERLLHVINLDGFEKSVEIKYHGTNPFGHKKLSIQSQDAFMLPLSMELDGRKIVYSTAEIFSREQELLVVRLTQPEDEIVFEGTGFVAESENYTISEMDGKTYINSKLDGRIHSFLDIRFCGL